MASVVLLLQHAPLQNTPSVVIDIEYPGQEAVLYSMFFEMRSHFSKNMPVVEFRRVGKRSGAHKVSHNTAKGKRTADVKLTYAKLQKLALPK